MARKAAKPKPKTKPKRKPKGFRLHQQLQQQANFLFPIYTRRLSTLTAGTDDAAHVAIGDTMIRLISGLLRSAQQIKAMTPEERRAAVSYLAMDFFDSQIVPVMKQTIPGFGRRIATAIGRKFYVNLIDGFIQGLTEIFNRTGWFDVDPGTNGAKTAKPTDPVAVVPSNGSIDGFIPY